MSNGAGIGLLTPMTSANSVLIGQSTQDNGPLSNQSNGSSDQGIGSTELIDRKPITTAGLLWPSGNRLPMSNGEINEGASPSSSSGDGDHPMLGMDNLASSVAGDEDLPMSTENGAESTENGMHASDMGSAADAEGVWSPDIEQAFQEALQIYPPCGRRKIILSDEGKMYGRNELIARYIKLRTGKTRTRKQVSSHIQVLARKKHREISTKIKDHGSKEKLQHSLQSMSSAQIVNMGAVGQKLAVAASLYGPTSPLQSGLWPPNATGFPGSLGDMPEMKGAFGPLATAGMPYSRPGGLPTGPPPSSYPQLAGFNPAAVAAMANNQAAAAALAASANTGPAYEGRSIWTPVLRLCEFSAYVEPESGAKSRHDLVGINSNDVTHADPLLETIVISEIMDKFPSGREGLKDLFEKGPKNAFFLVKSWADISFNIGPEDANAFYAVDSRYESNSSMTISVSTKVCSFGKQVVEKVETEFALYDQGRFVYRINRSPMCEYMVKFIHQLKKLPETYMMNSVLENFTILQVVTNKDTRETLLCVAFVFEISQEQDGLPQYHIYRLIPGQK